MARILELWDRGCNAPLMTQARYDKDEIQQFALNLLLASGMELEKAKVVCEILVEGDLMGHTTHGLQMLIPYLKSIEAKTMTLSGTYSILRETPSHLVMDGRFLPGPWLVCEALDWAAGRIQEQGVVSMCITQSPASLSLAMLIISGSPSRPVTSFRISAPAFNASWATFALLVSILIGMVSSDANPSMTGITRSISSLMATGSL